VLNLIVVFLLQFIQQYSVDMAFSGKWEKELVRLLFQSELLQGIEVTTESGAFKKARTTNQAYKKVYKGIRGLVDKWRNFRLVGKSPDYEGLCLAGLFRSMTEMERAGIIVSKITIHWDEDELTGFTSDGLMGRILSAFETSDETDVKEGIWEVEEGKHVVPLFREKMVKKLFIMPYQRLLGREINDDEKFLFATTPLFITEPLTFSTTITITSDEIAFDSLLDLTELDLSEEVLRSYWVLNYFEVINEEDEGDEEDDDEGWIEKRKNEEGEKEKEEKKPGRVVRKLGEPKYVMVDSDGDDNGEDTANTRGICDMGAKEDDLSQPDEYEDDGFVVGNGYLSSEEERRAARRKTGRRKRKRSPFFDEDASDETTIATDIRQRQKKKDELQANFAFIFEAETLVNSLDDLLNWSNITIDQIYTRYCTDVFRMVENEPHMEVLKRECKRLWPRLNTVIQLCTNYAAANENHCKLLRDLKRDRERDASDDETRAILDDPSSVFVKRRKRR